MPLNFLAARPACYLDLVCSLRVQPELRSVPEVPGQSQRGVSSDTAALLNNLTHPRNRNMKIARERVDTGAQGRHELFLQDLAWVDRWYLLGGNRSVYSA
jgi:hypothetical protein